jgi:hypothetical protein
MAIRRKEESQSNGQGKGRIRFRYMDSERAVDFSVENVGTESVAEGLRSIANALAGRTIAVEPVRRLPKNASTGSSTTVDSEEEAETPEPGGVPDEEEVEALEEAADAGDGTPKPKRTPKLKAPKLLAVPNLTEAKVPLADFFKQKHPEDMMDKYAVIAVWYKTEFQITDITIDRVFTAFKHLGIESQLPANLEKPLKNLTYTKKWFEKAPGAGAYSLNWMGESEVGKMATGAAK